MFAFAYVFSPECLPIPLAAPVDAVSLYLLLVLSDCMQAVYTLCLGRLDDRAYASALDPGLLPLGGGFAGCIGLGGPPAAHSSSATKAKIQSSLDYPPPAGCLFFVDERGRLHPAKTSYHERAKHLSSSYTIHPPKALLLAHAVT